MNKTKINAQVVADSLDSRGNRLTSLLITFPRIILAEVNTHRMLSKNTSSSRAIPFKKMVESVQNNPFIPIAWQKEHKGMQGTEYLTEKEDIEYAIGTWLHARDAAIQEAKIITSGAGVTKQLANRLLEPFMWTTMLITGSKEGWDNFFNLRCPVYEQWYYNDDGSQDFEIRRSRKEYISRSGYPNSMFFVRPDESKIAMLEATDLDWLQRNKGQAEIHMMALAESIYDAMNESTPKQLQAGEWHIPFEDKIHKVDTSVFSNEDVVSPIFDSIRVKISTAMAAHTSYTTVGNEPVKSLEKWIEIHDKLMSYDPPHSSPMEHCARAMSDEEYYSFIKGNFNQEIEIDADGFIDISTHSNNSNSFGWCNNLKGFIPYRYLLETEELRF